MCPADRLMVLYISVKFHENIKHFLQVTEWTQFCDGQMDGRTDQEKNNMYPDPIGERHN